MKLFSSPSLAFALLVPILAAVPDTAVDVASSSSATVIVDGNGPRSVIGSRSFSSNPKNANAPKALKQKRRVKKSGKGKKGDSDKKPLEATIKPLDKDGDYEDLSGWVSVEYNNDDKLVIDYSIKEGPKRCKDCVLAIYSGKSCKKLDKKYYDTDENPWTVDEKAVYKTNKKRRAAGFFKTDNGYSYKKNECKFIVLLDEDEDRRRLASSSTDRALKSKKKKKKTKKIACGQLIPEGKSKDYCD